MTKHNVENSSQSFCITVQGFLESFLRPRYLRKGPNLETQALDKGKESKSGRAIMASLPLLDFGFDSDTNAKQSVGLILNIFQSSAETGKWFFDRLVMKEGSHCSICYPSSI